VSDLFPAVVKNVASKNIEVKKLVYVYLTRYLYSTPNPSDFHTDTGTQEDKFFKLLLLCKSIGANRLACSPSVSKSTSFPTDKYRYPVRYR
jgi:hypothetical protein